MQIEPVQFSARAAKVVEQVEEIANGLIRGADGLLGALGLGGRKAPYDDHAFEFLGGANDELRRQHYDKSLRLLWKAQEHLPFLSFKDCTVDESALLDQALRGLTDDERAARKRINSAEFRALLDREYTREQKQAIVDILAAIGHGEAYAWMVSTDVLGMVQSTGARAALTMQVMEEAKHFVVLRELLQAFDVEIRRQSVWEYLLLERVHKAVGLEKFFGMNVVVEGIALSLFGMMSTLPGLEVLRLFHLDESRHTALPMNYLKHYPLSAWQKRNPLRRLHRIRIILPAIALIFQMEKPLGILGIDALEFGGSVVRKLTYLSQRAEFFAEGDAAFVNNLVNTVLNAYATRTREGHAHRDYIACDATRGEREQQIEAAIFGTGIGAQDAVA